MMNKYCTLITALCLVLGLAACGTSSTGGGTTTADILNTLTILDFTNNNPIVGAKICPTIDDKALDCLTTDDKGVASSTFTLKGGEHFVVRVDSKGYYPVRWEAMVTLSEGVTAVSGTWTMPPEIIADAIVKGLNAVPDATKGHATVVAQGPADEKTGLRVPLAGVGVSIAPAAEKGPHYFCESISKCLFADKATATTTSGLTGFFNIAVGKVVATFTPPAGHECKVPFAGLSEEGNSISSTVEAERLSYFVVFCDKTK
jgi:hypothetical protein